MTFSDDALDQAADQRWLAYQDAATAAGVGIADAADRTEEIIRVFGLSEFAATACRRSPDIVDWLFSGDVLDHSSGRDAYRLRIADALKKVESDAAALVNGAGMPPDLGGALRRFRRREMVRIAWRDLSGKAELEAVLAELSALADVCIDTTLSSLYEAFCQELGTPTGKDGTIQRPVVIGMGKLGAEELNFSSDVDLIFAYPQSGQTDRGMGTDAFFSKLFRKLVSTLGNPTPEGFVFRVDTNLRPFGEGGPLVSTFASMERYYQSQGREWERYAWIKARPVAGDLTAGERLLGILRPFVYRRYLDYGVFESLREMKRKIALEVRQRGMERNIKLGAGGIREVEFFGQIFQLIRGGVVPELRCRGIVDILRTLGTERYIDAGVRDELIRAYRFLRRVENRLQADADRQTHDLPTEAIDRSRLAASMGFAEYPAFEKALGDHRRRVHAHFSTLLEADDTEETEADAATASAPDFTEIWQRGLGDEAAVARLRAAGYDPPEDAFRLIQDLHRQLAQHPLRAEGQRRLNRLMPVLIAAAGRARHPVPVLDRLLNLIRSVRKRTNYLSLLIENPSALDHLVRLSDASSLIATFVARHPVLLDELLDPRTLYAPPDRSQLVEELRRRLGPLAPEDLEERIEDICIFQQAHGLRIAAADVAGTLPLMRVSDRLSDLAEVILAEVMELSWSHLVRRHGCPARNSEQEDAAGKRFAVVAYGKLGGLELGYSSDLDIVFLHGAEPGETTAGPQAIDAPQFYARLGQRMIHILTTHTRAGRIYEVDMRLRPSGSAGPLVSQIRAFESYLADKAWTWEHQALIRARAVAGDPALCEAFEALRQRVLAVPRDTARLRTEVADMRERLRREQDKSGDGFDLKQGAGGIVDIEFLVQYLVLAGAYRHPELLRWSDNVRQLESLVESKTLTPETAHFLREAYLTYRSAAHRLSLQEKPGRVPADRFASTRKRVTAVYRRLLG